MRYVLPVVAVLIILVGCSQEPAEQKPEQIKPGEEKPTENTPAEKTPEKEAVSASFEGTWEGSYTEKTTPTTVELELKLVDGKYKGTFKAVEHGHEESYEIMEAKVTGKMLKFILPITGKIDSESVRVYLELKDGVMEGTISEVGECEVPLPISFKKK
jgi:hypothetical protein